MQIVIDVDDEILRYFSRYDCMDGFPYSRKLLDAFHKCIPLPKGHGRLIDVNDIEWARHQEERNYIDYDAVDWDDIKKAPTIIEAESEEENGRKDNDI